MPSYAASSIVPVGLSMIQYNLMYTPNWLENNGNLLITCGLLGAAALAGQINAINTEFNLKARAIEEGWGTKKRSSIIQKGQFKSYCKWMAAGFIVSGFFNAVAPDISFFNKAEIDDTNTQQSEQIPLYQEPQ